MRKERSEGSSGRVWKEFIDGFWMYNVRLPNGIAKIIDQYALNGGLLFYDWKEGRVIIKLETGEIIYPPKELLNAQNSLNNPTEPQID